MHTIKSIKDVIYTRHPDGDLRLDLYVPPPATDLAPVILAIHGGGWREGSKDAFSCDFLAQQGFVVAAIQYRFVSQALAPANIRDCKAAVRWLRAHAGKYRWGADRIGAFGASAGGHLAALLGLSNGFAAFEEDGDTRGYSSSVQAVCDFCGPADLTRIAIPEIRQKYPFLYELTEAYLGGPVEQRLDLARLVSPLTYVSAAAPPTLICHGTADDGVPVEESKVLYEALKRVGADVTLKLLENAPHGWDWRLTDDLVAQFFKRTLWG